MRLSTFLSRIALNPIQINSTSAKNEFQKCTKNVLASIANINTTHKPTQNISKPFQNRCRKNKTRNSEPCLT